MLYIMQPHAILYPVNGDNFASLYVYGLYWLYCSIEVATLETCMHACICNNVLEPQACFMIRVVLIIRLVISKNQ